MINRVEGPTGPFYSTEVALGVKPPTGLTADVVGAEFPSFTSAVIEDVPLLQVFKPVVGQNVDASSSFQWNANNEPLSVFEIYSTGIDANGQEVLVACTAVDDGSFTFPESVRSQLGANFDDFETTYLRIVYNTALSGDALLITGNSTAVTQ